MNQRCEITICNAAWAYLEGFSDGTKPPGDPAKFGFRTGDSYYLALPVGQDGDCLLKDSSLVHGPFYSERMFIWGTRSEDGKALTHDQLCDVLRSLSLYSGSGFWNDAFVYARTVGDEPVYDTALRATLINPQGWHRWLSRADKLPEGWVWERNHGQPSGTLFYEPPPPRPSQDDILRALEESVKALNRYADLLNISDGLDRRTYANVGEWIAYLRERQYLPAQGEKDE